MLARLAAAAIGGQIAFVASWLAAQALEPRYDPASQTVSALAGATAENPWLLTIGLLAWALGTAACGETLRRTLPRRRWWWLPLAAVWGAATGMAMLAALPLDCSPAASEECLRRAQAGRLSWRHEAHEAVAGLVLLAVALSPLALWLALRPGRGARIALLCGVAGVVLFALVQDAVRVDPAQRGGGQRVLLVATVLWLCGVALSSLRRGARAPAYNPSSRG